MCSAGKCLVTVSSRRRAHAASYASMDVLDSMSALSNDFTAASARWSSICVAGDADPLVQTERNDSISFFAMRKQASSPVLTACFTHVKTSAPAVVAFENSIKILLPSYQLTLDLESEGMYVVITMMPSLLVEKSL